MDVIGTTFEEALEEGAQAIVAHAKNLQASAPARTCVVLERFNSKWTPEPYSGCWLWTAKLRDGQYGAFAWDGKQVLAHRASFELYVGEIPSGYCVLHRCDTPSCVNPDHLFLGTHQENMWDKCEKRRHNTKLKGDDVRQIYSLDAPHEEIARQFGIRREHVSKIKNGRCWKFLKPRAGVRVFPTARGASLS